MIYIFGLAILSSILYRASGHGGFKGAKLLRRIGCAIIFLTAFWIWKGFALANYIYYFITFILSFLALSTYNDWLTNDGSETWLCWIVTGLLYSLSSLPLIWCGASIYGFILRTVTLALLITWIREKTSNVWIEELSSGFLYVMTVAFL